MKRNGIAGILATVLLSAWSLPAGAEETYKLDPVLVTAEKRTENVQDVPVSVTAISEQQIKDFMEENPGIVINIVETIRPLRNAVAHNGAVFDSRFSQSVKYPKTDRNLAAVGELLDEDLSIGYRLNFNSIIDYIVLLAYLLTLLTHQKKRSRDFLRKCLRELEKLESAVGVDTYMMIVGSGDRQKYGFIEGFIDGYGRKR